VLEQNQRLYLPEEHCSIISMVTRRYHDWLNGCVDMAGREHMNDRVKDIYTIILKEYGPYEPVISFVQHPYGRGYTIYTYYDRAKRILKELTSE